MRLHFAIDFDGTVTFGDSTDALLEKFADPLWREVEEAWVAGLIGSRECLARQAALLRATPSQIDEVAASIAIDPDFAHFVERARQIGATMEIISDGFDRCILPLMKRTGVDLPVTCNWLYQVAAGRWAVEFPASSPQCQSGVCKCKAAKTSHLLVLIGDGRSDYCLASRADFVLAKGHLARHCAEQHYAFAPITCFADAIEWLEPFLAKTTAPARFHL